MKAMNNIRDFGAGADMIIMKCKESLQKSQIKLKISIERPIILSGSVKEFDSFLGKGLSD